MVLRVGNGAKWSGGYFFPLGMGLQLLKKIQKPENFVEKLVCLKLLAKVKQNVFFDELLGFLDLFEELEAHTQGEKISPRPFCTTSHPQNH